MNQQRYAVEITSHKDNYTSHCCYFQQQPGRDDHQHQDVGEHHQQPHQQTAVCIDLVSYSHRTADGVVGRVTHLLAAGAGKAETQHLAVDARLDQSFTNAVQRAAK